MFKLLKVLFSSVIPKAFVFILNLILARTLDINEFGFYGYVKSFFNFFETIVSSSLVPHSVSSLSNKTLKIEQVTAIYFLFAIVSSLSSAIVIISVGSMNSIYIPIILCVGVFGSIANSYLYVCIVTEDKTNILFASSFLTIVLLALFFYFLSIDSAVLALIFAVSFNFLDFLFKWFFLKIYNPNFKFHFDFNDLQLSKPILLICGLSINGVLFLIQRILLAKTENGMQQMAYLEIVMQAFSLISVFLASQSNYLMSRKFFFFFNREYVASNLMLILTLISSVSYAFFVFIGKDEISWIFGISITQSLCTATAFMIFCYSIAFYSVRIAISKNMQKVTLNSTIFSSGIAFIPYLFLDSSALSIVYSYSVFYLSLFVFNGLFVFRGGYEVKKDVA